MHVLVDGPGSPDGRGGVHGRGPSVPDPRGARADDPVALLAAAADALARLDPADLPDAAVADLAVATRRGIDRLEGCFVRLARAAHLRGLGSESGAPSTAAWLARRAVMRTGDARAAIEAGEICDLLAATGEAWRSGEISTAAARTIGGARVEGHDGPLEEAEPVMLGFARAGDLRAVARLAARFRNLARSDGRAPRVPDGLYVSRGYTGRTVLSGDFGDLAAETVVTALHAYTDPPSDDDRRPGSQRRADALVRICEVALERLPAGRRDHGQVSVVVDWATLAGDASGRADGQYTGPVHLDDVHRLLCDTTVSRIVTDPAGIPIDVGRARRNPPARLRRALVARDEGCRFPGCDRPPGWCDAHHIHHWTRGGSTDLPNLVLLCSHHHRLVHRPGWVLRLDADQLHIRGPDHSRVA